MGPRVGDQLGDVVGESVGAFDGMLDGIIDGDAEGAGEVVGIVDGRSEGFTVKVGFCDGETDGKSVGLDDIEGALLGAIDIVGTGVLTRAFAFKDFTAKDPANKTKRIKIAISMMMMTFRRRFEQLPKQNHGFLLSFRERLFLSLEPKNESSFMRGIFTLRCEEVSISPIATPPIDCPPVASSATASSESNE